MRRADWILVGSFVAAMLAIHVRAMAVLAYDFGEVGSVQQQVELLRTALAHGSLWAFVVDAPLSHSNAMTPLWPWQQFFFAELFGNGHAVSRLVPTLWTIGPIVLSYVVVFPRLGRLTAAGTSLTFVLLDTVLWTGTKSEYTESMLLTCVIGAIILTLRGTVRDFVGAATLLGLTPLTYLGKGLFLYGVFGLWVIVVCAIERWDGLNRRLGLLAISLVPTAFWFALAVHRADALADAGMPIIGELGTFHSAVDQAMRVTVDYFSRYRPFLRGTPSDVLIVYADFKAWPTGTLLAPWALLGLGVGLVRAFRDTRPDVRGLLMTLPVMGLLPFAYVVLRGFMGERFTLIWGFPFALAVGLGLSKTAEWLLDPQPGHALRGVVAMAWVWLYTAAALSMTSWVLWRFDARRFLEIALGGMAAAALALLLRRIAPHSLRPAVALIPVLPLAVILPWSLMTYGPLMWGHRWGWGIEGVNADAFEATLRLHRWPKPSEMPEMTSEAGPGEP
jgi:hypothetical protein